jgi:hypothetical protein
MDAAPGTEPKILLNHLMEGIGLAMDLERRRMYFTDLAGTVYSANLDGSDEKVLLFLQGNVTGIVYTELPDAA